MKKIFESWKKWKKWKKSFEIHRKIFYVYFSDNAWHFSQQLEGKVTFFTQGSFYLQCYLSSLGKEMHYCCSYLYCLQESHLDYIPISLKFTKYLSPLITEFFVIMGPQSTVVLSYLAFWRINSGRAVIMITEQGIASSWKRVQIIFQKSL